MKLYKKDSKGKIRVLEIFIRGSEVVQLSGLLDGKKTERVSQSKAKNIGKSNETTAEQQAGKDAESKIIKKLIEGYFKTAEEAESNKVVLPQLAKVYEDHSHKIDWNNTYIQPKLDGIRSLGRKSKLISRKNREIDTLPHINTDLKDVLNYLDGELYVHGLNFQENTRLIKKNREGSEDVKFYVYDLVNANMTFIDRYELLSKIVTELKSNNIILVPTVKVNSEEEVMAWNATFISQGYEGSMVRWGDTGYKVNGRSENLLKYKSFQDLAIKVVDVVPSDKDPEKGQFILHWKGAKGHPYGEDVIGCGMKYSHEERKDILLNKKDYIGKTAEVRFFEFSETGVPRFPVVHGIRIDK